METSPISVAKPKINFWNSVFLIGAPILFLVLAPIDLIKNGWSPAIGWFTLVFYALTAISITGGYHRLFSHRAYDANPFVRLFYLLFGAGALQNSALKWSIDHRLHHRYVDTDLDPYNIKKGFFWAHMGWIFYVDPEEKLDPKQFPKDLAQDPLVLLQHKYYLPIALFMTFGLPTLFGWLVADNALGGFVWGGLLRIVVESHLGYMVNSTAHYYGTQPFSDTSTARDNWILAFFTMGEGYHNYHHQFQYDYRNGVRWHNWDPTKWLITLTSWLGLAGGLKRVPDSTILIAELKMKEKRLAERGVDVSQLAVCTQKLEAVQARLLRAVAEYRELKARKTQEAREKLRHMRQELIKAREEFRAEYVQWRAMFRHSLQAGATA